METIGPLLCSDVLYILLKWNITVHGGINECSHLILSLSAQATAVVYGFFARSVNMAFHHKLGRYARDVYYLSMRCLRLLWPDTGAENMNMKRARMEF